MHSILTTACKEVLLLIRDRAGLLVLFLMPATLVVVITLVQENILQLSGQRPTAIQVLDQDQGLFGRRLKAYLEAGQLKVVDWTSSVEALRTAAGEGTCQAGLILSKGISASLQEQMDRHLAELSTAGAAAPLPELDVLFDPATMVGFRAGLLARVQIAAQAAELEMKATRLSTLAVSQSGMTAGLSSAEPENRLQAFFTHTMTTVRERSGNASQATIAEVSNPVNQNVPAWALFGMFFTAIPIAGTLLAERQSGIALRLAAMPVSPLQLLAGKMLAYLGVGLIQFILITLIGMFLFPHLGLPAFDLPANPLTLIPPVCVSSLAACGFGICLGSYCRTYEQASTVGATAVVAAAALGGIMVPVYAMPPLMQHLSILSPLNWAVTCFSDLLVRGNPWQATLHDQARLLAFSAVTLILSWKRAYRWGM